MVKRKREEGKKKAVETGAGEEQSEKQNDDQHTFHTNPSLPWMRKPLDLDGFPALAVERVAGLDHRLVKALQENGISSLFPVQVAVWQLTIGHGGGERDICLCSPTGSGKTLAYALPIVQRLSSRVVRRLRALIVLPTRDLAMQVKAVFDVLAPAVGLAVGLAIGQTQMATEASELVSIPRECEHYFAKAEAKLLDLVESRVDILVATPASVVATHRLFLLLGCLDNPPFKAVEYSSHQHQHSRSKSLADFRSGHANVLVASDGMTRGMDVEGIMNVINYDVPVYAKTYVHRVGRTARAGRSGSSYTLLCKEEVRHFKELLKKIDHGACKDFKLQPSAVQDLYPSYLEALEKLKDVVANDTVKPSG